MKDYIICDNNQCIFYHEDYNNNNNSNLHGIN